MKIPQIVLIGTLVFSPGVASIQAETYNYQPTGNGVWSVQGNWSPMPGTQGPSTGDTAVISSASSSDQIISYDAGASGTLGALTINETTDGITNEVVLGRTLTLASSLVLGSTSGTVELATGSTSSNFALSVGTGTISVNSGGVLAFGGASGGSITASAVTVASGGTLSTLAAAGETFGASGAPTALTINSGGTLSVTSGSSMVVTGNFTISGMATNTNNFANNASS
ncbi:MAG: hypothetical protein INR62_04140, partial [Rhodospirillales bacterium]|nr:hypothetical protein [Acetobacter sp.]